ncbi:hypothetical protein DL96DRAFT_1590632 [Flagelloscypha sp. PMI_526]|nr:hypothetical protein DL96DRAFT_1590632 [Flagelloscypha sp. PMI_526]
MAWIIRQPHLVPRHLRRLVYASILLSFASFAFSMVNYGILAYFTSPIAAFFTWIYHLVLIILHNKRSRPSDPAPYRLIWLRSHALVWGYGLAILWTAAFSVTFWTFIMELMLREHFDDYWLNLMLIIVFFETLFNLGSAAVMWSLVALATHYKRTGKFKSEETQLQKRAGPREWVNEIYPQEQHRIEEA